MDTALQAASFGGHHTVVQMLIEAGADVNAPIGLTTALRVASFGGHHTVVQMLIEAGADVSAPRREYDTALKAVSDDGHDTVV